MCGSACERGQNPRGESNSNSHFPRYLLGSAKSPRKSVERKIANREFRSEGRRSAWGSDGTGKQRDGSLGAAGFEAANHRRKLNNWSRNDDRVAGGSAKLTNVGARAVRSEIGAKMELRSQEQKSKKYGQPTASKAVKAH